MKKKTDIHKKPNCDPGDGRLEKPWKTSMEGKKKTPKDYAKKVNYKKGE